MPLSSAAQAELEKTKRDGDNTPSTLDPDVAEALRNVEPVLASGNLTGDEIEFEGFMFNKGASAPLVALAATIDEDLEALHHDMGPVFDPTPWAQAVREEEDDGDEYGDVDGAFFAGKIDQPVAAPNTGVQEASSNTGDLPFWLQGEF